MTLIPAPPSDTILPYSSVADGLFCESCGKDEFLIIEAIGPAFPPTSDSVEIEYSCSECEKFYAHKTSVQNVANVLNLSGLDSLLRFGTQYLHCGSPMEEVFTRVPGKGRGRRLKTLICKCGFTTDAF